MMSKSYKNGKKKSFKKLFWYFFISDKRIDTNDEFYYTNDIGAAHIDNKNFSATIENIDFIPANDKIISVVVDQDKNENFASNQGTKTNNWQPQKNQNPNAPAYPRHGYAGNAYGSQLAYNLPRRLYKRSLPPAVSPMKNVIGVLRRMSTTVKTIGR